MSGLGLGWLVGLSVSPVIQIILASLVAIVVSISSALAGLHPSDSDREQDDSQEVQADKPRAHRSRRSFPFLDPLPIMSMVIGLACGASVGVYARTNDWLGARNNILVEEWKETGLSAKDITTRVFDHLYPPPTHDESTAQETGADSPAREDSGTSQSTEPAVTAPPASGKEKKATASRPAPKADPAMEAQHDFRIHTGVLFSVSMEQCTRLRNAEDEDELRREMASSNDDGLVNLARTCKSYECLRAGVIKACAKYK
jgi:hypothetical protein